MNASTVVASAVGVKEAFRALDLAIKIFAFLFPDQAVVTENSSYDIIIAGAGSAGCVLANRLSANPNISVLLIEAGDIPGVEEMMPGFASLYTERSRFDWNYTSVKNNYTYQCYKNDVYGLIRGHGLGGSSSINYNLYVRGDPNDYKRIAAIAKNTTWDYENVLPYFIKSERLEDETVLNSSYKHFHGTKGEVGVNKFPYLENLKYFNALEEIGHKMVLDTNGNYTLGFTFPMFNIAQNMRQSSCFSFVTPVKNRTNLHVLRNTKVNNVVFKNMTAVGVNVTTDGNISMVLKANLEVILSAGAFNSPQILMLSGIGPKEHLKSFNITSLVDLPVGYNLQDHVGVTIAHQTDVLNSSAPAFNPYAPSVPFMNGFVSLNKSQTFPDAQFILVSSKAAQGILSFLAVPIEMDDDICQTAYEANQKREVLVGFLFNMLPVSSGRVMLASSNPNDKPKIYLGAYNNKTDLVNVKRYVKEYLRIENSTYFKSVSAKRIELAGDRCSSFEEDSDEYWDCYILCLMLSIHHYTSTCPMGTVLDSQLRVHNVTGLRVVDASAFPILPSGNTNAPTMMLAEKAADMIKHSHGI